MPVLFLDLRCLHRLLPSKDAGHRKSASFADHYVLKAVIFLHFRKYSLELKRYRRQWCPHGNGDGRKKAAVCVLQYALAMILGSYSVNA